MVARAPARRARREAHAFATGGYDLVIGVGAGAAAAVDNVARTFPDVDFAVVDASQQAQDAKPPNVRGLLFKEQEAGYLVGYLAGLLNAKEAGSKQTIGAVGGRKVPWVDRYIAGFRAGARKANPQTKTLEGYSQTFVDQAKCKELALGQIAQGCRRRLRGRGPLRPRRRVGRRGEERLGDRRRRRPERPRPAHPHERGPAGRRRGLRDRPGRAVGRLHRGREPRLRRCLRRCRPRAGQRPGAGGCPLEGTGGPGRSRGREDHRYPGTRT